ncbi:DUF4168 domain-containing protein [Marinobacter gelidimuriae]|uniref:DUF4168 domain-containing protein n=1 Tax=Marinobacter gelidimuriae TaxID=2739064 RepID=UPI0003AA5710|nr:DUF4168 domain-containing protein [Marinobacter gelidimuriae]
MLPAPWLDRRRRLRKLLKVSAIRQRLAHTAFYSDAQLHKFVDAQQQINTLREEYKDRIDSAESEADATGLRDEVNARMAEIIENQNLDIDTYNAMAIAYNSEPRGRNRIDALMPWCRRPRPFLYRNQPAR